jgi:hypothetical protein
MDPLIEVSTGQGRNMRETCARVLAAALMTGAIATVVGMSALFDTPREVGRALTVPPSSLQRSVRMSVPPARHRAPAVSRLVSAHTNKSTPVRPEIMTRRLAVRRQFVVRHARPRPRQLAAVKPKTAPAPVVQPSQLAPTPASPPVTVPAPDVSGDEQSQGKDGGDQGGDHGDDHGHGHGHDHGHHGQKE